MACGAKNRQGRASVAGKSPFDHPPEEVRAVQGAGPRPGRSSSERSAGSKPRGYPSSAALLQGELQRAQAVVEAQEQDFFEVPVVAGGQRADRGQRVGGGSQAHVPDHQAMPARQGVGAFDQPAARDVYRLRLCRRADDRVERLPVGQ